MTHSSKVVLLTGASGGLGSAIAKHLKKQGYKVYGAGRKQVKSPDFTWLYIDLNQPETIDTAIQSILEKEKKIDILINNAGIGVTGSLEEMNMSDVRKAFEVNFFGLLYLIQKTLPLMRQQHYGTVINISSIAGYTGLPFRGVYSATKSAVMRLSEALSSEVQQFGIKVVDIAPGDFKTNIADGRLYTPLKQDSPYFEDYKRVLKMIDEEVAGGLGPDNLGKKIPKIIDSKNPKLRYNIGIFLQKMTPYLTCVLSGRLFEKLILKHYKMNK